MAFDIKTTERAGFTLIEIVVSAGLLTLFLGGVFVLFRSGSRSFSQGSWRAQEQKSTQIFFSELERELGQSSPRMVRVQSDGTNISDLDTPIYLNDKVFSTNGIPKACPIDFTAWKCLMAFSITRPYYEANATFSTPVVPGRWSGVSLWGRQRTLRILRSGDPTTFGITPDNLPGAMLGVPGTGLVNGAGFFQPDFEHNRNSDVTTCLDRFSILASPTSPTSISLVGRFVRYENNLPTPTMFEQSITIGLASNSTLTPVAIP